MAGTAFVHSAEKINKIIKDNDLKKVCMQGPYNDLKKLKPIVEDVYDNYVFWLDSWKSDCFYMGWDREKDKEILDAQEALTKGITEKFKEIYALILAGLGETCTEKDVK